MALNLRRFVAAAIDRGALPLNLRRFVAAVIDPRGSAPPLYHRSSGCKWKILRHSLCDCGAREITEDQEDESHGLHLSL